jgi:hypothetical protein
MKSTVLGHFIAASRPSREARSSAAAAGPGKPPSAGCTIALTCSPRLSSGTPNTANVGDLGLRQELGFHLARADVDHGRNDQIGHPVIKAQETGVVEKADIAGGEKFRSPLASVLAESPLYTKPARPIFS